MRGGGEEGKGTGVKGGQRHRRPAMQREQGTRGGSEIGVGRVELQACYLP